MSGLKGKIEQGLVKALGKVKGTLKESAFIESGVLTPEEFVIAGDLLVYKCPGWTWEAGVEAKRVAYLPADKQYLVSKGVPCRLRASALEKFAESNAYDDIDVEGDDGWCTPSTVGTGEEEEEEEIREVDVITGVIGGKAKEVSESDSDDSSDIPDMEEFDEVENLEEVDATTLQEDHIERSRRYDLSITYDNYYQTPKLWLFGYGEDGTPLASENIFQDISEDHARKTVTMDTHPHQTSTHAFIHPCKHAHVMKTLTARSVASGNEARVDQYLFLFLKFMASVLPTIEYDYTPALKA